MSDFRIDLRRVTKIDAAREQLQEAILMFFEGRSAIAVHTLVLAAHQVLHDYMDRESSMIKSEKALNEGGQDLIKRYNKEFNFFKHAKDDKDATLLFDAELHTFFLADALHLYAAATGDWLPTHQVFNFWFILKHPNVIEAETAKDALSQAQGRGWKHENKKSFLLLIEEMEAIRAKGKVTGNA